MRDFYKDSAITPSYCVEGTFPSKELNFIVSKIVNGNVLPKKEPTVVRNTSFYCWLYCDIDNER